MLQGSSRVVRNSLHRLGSGSTGILLTGCTRRIQSIQGTLSGGGSFGNCFGVAGLDVHAMQLHLLRRPLPAGDIVDNRVQVVLGCLKILEYRRRSGN